MLLAQKIAVGSVALTHYLNRKPFSIDQSSQNSDLPIELILLICDNLSIQDQVRASRISKHWFNALLGLPWVQYLQQYGDAPAHYFDEGFNWRKALKRREAAEINFSEGRYWRETLAASPSNMHSRRYYLVSSVRGMEVLVHQCYWTSSSYEEDAEIMRSYTFDLASETMTQKGGAAGMWLNGVMVQPVYNTHGVDWTKFTTFRPPTEFEAENGAYDAVVREYDLEKDHKMRRNDFLYFRITEPQQRLKVVPNSKHGSNSFLIYTEQFTRLKRYEDNHTVLFFNKSNSSSYSRWFESFDGILAYWGNYVVKSTERSIEFYNMSNSMTERVYPLDISKLAFAKVAINGDIMAYTSDDRTITVWDLKQNRLLTTVNYLKRVLGSDEEPEMFAIVSLAVHGSKVVVNMGWSVVIDWRTKKHLELPYEVEDVTILPDGSLILASKFNVSRVRFDVDTTQTVKLTKMDGGELSTEPVVLGQLKDYLAKKYETQRCRSLTFLINQPTGYPSYKGEQIHAVARVTAFWMADTEVPATNTFVQALKQLKAPPMTSSVHETQRCAELPFSDFKAKDPVFLYERLIDGFWIPCNPFELNLVKHGVLKKRLALVSLSAVIFIWHRYRSKATNQPSEEDTSPINIAPAIQVKKPLSVNYHFSRECNYKCKFCFHTNTNNFKLSLEEAKQGIKLLHEAGMEKINFAGGEPFLFPDLLGEMCKYSRKLGLAVSIVSNGSKIKEKWFREWGQYLNILAISCDSFDEETNVKIGRGNGQHVKQVYKVAEWCREYRIKFKMNSVICSYNYHEDMNVHITQLAPFRWKVFQVLLIDGENVGYNKTKKDARNLLITREQFDAFVTRHSMQADRLVPEPNDVMKDSYLILDERMRFLNCQDGKKDPSKSIFEVSVQDALAQSGFDGDNFVKRQGVYDWGNDTQPPSSSCASGVIGDIEDLA